MVKQQSREISASAKKEGRYDSGCETEDGGEREGKE
jgi:hypothetical protein